MPHTMGSATFYTFYKTFFNDTMKHTTITKVNISHLFAKMITIFLFLRAMVERNAKKANLVKKAES